METIALPGGKGGYPLLQQTLEIIVFSTLPRAEAALGFINFYRTFFKRYGRCLGWYKTNVMKVCKKLNCTGLDQVQQMLTDKKALKSYLLGVEQHSGPSANQYGLPSFEFFSEEDMSDPQELIKRSFLRICLPIQEVAHADDFVAFVQSLLAEIDFESGYCGYSYYWNTSDSDAERELQKVNRGWLLRFPGLAYGKPLALISFVDKGILGVNWLTLIGFAQAKQLGGPKALNQLLGQHIEVAEIANNRGVLIRAGNEPELGDTNRNQHLSHYHKVGRAVSDLQMPDEWRENFSVVGLTPEESQEWYGRFFDGTG